LFVLACALAQPAATQVEDKAVPMDKAPFHIPVFSNDYLILLNVNIPPGRNTGYHIHYADSVSVNLTPASQTNQDYGSEEVGAPGTGGDGEPGRATFTDVTKNGPRTHKATNVGPTPFHNISFILKNRAPAGTTVSDRSGVRGYTQIMDNARLRAWRVALKPGEATGQITQTAPGLRVYVHGGVLAEMVPGSADRGMAPYEGDFIWQDAGQTRAVKNTGTTLIEFVEFELNRAARIAIYQIEQRCPRPLWIGKDRTVDSFEQSFTLIGKPLSESPRTWGSRTYGSSACAAPILPTFSIDFISWLNGAGSATGGMFSGFGLAIGFLATRIGRTSPRRIGVGLNGAMGAPKPYGRS
jgi:hypothetical protein